MKNLLVTGGCGFIGSNFVRYLLEESDFEGRVINIDKLTYAGNPESLNDIAEKYPDRYVFVHGDICNLELLNQLVHFYQIDGICHLAAESHVDRSIISPDSFIQSNIIGTFNLLELARKHQDRIEIFHHVSTDEVFGSLGDEGFFTEETSYAPQNPYSASKASSDHLVRAYFNTYKLPITVTNCSNNYGPFQFPEKLIPLTILNLINNKPIPVYGDGQNTRDWLYVVDHCRAIWCVMKNADKGSTYNIGGHNEIKNLSLVETVCDIVGDLYGPSCAKANRDLITFVKDRPGHDWRYAIDAQKVETDLGWYPEETFDTGIKKTVDWYLKNLDWVQRILSGDYQAWIQENYGGDRQASA